MHDAASSPTSPAAIAALRCAACVLWGLLSAPPPPTVHAWLRTVLIRMVALFDSVLLHGPTPRWSHHVLQALERVVAALGPASADLLSTLAEFWLRLSPRSDSSSAVCAWLHSFRTVSPFAANKVCDLGRF